MAPGYRADSWKSTVPDRRFAARLQISSLSEAFWRIGWRFFQFSVKYRFAELSRRYWSWCSNPWKNIKRDSFWKKIKVFMFPLFSLALQTWPAVIGGSVEHRALPQEIVVEYCLSNALWGAQYAFLMKNRRWKYPRASKRVRKRLTKRRRGS